MSTLVQPVEVGAAPRAKSGAGLLGQLLSFPTLIGAGLIARAYWTCRSQIADPDLGFHLLNGKHLLAHGHFPTIDSYSFTAAGSTWLDHAWLPEVLYYLAHHALGWRGVFVVFAVCVAALYIGIFLLCRKETNDPLAAGVATLFGGWLAMVGFTPRTQNIGWLCFVAVYAILLRFRAARGDRLWLIPLIFCLWINCHGAWPFGFIVFGAVLGTGWIREDIGQLRAAPWTAAERKKLIAVFAASAAALFINPFGYRLVFLPMRVALRQQMGIRWTEEYASVDFNDPRGYLVMVILAAVFLMALIPRKPWRIDDALLTMLVLYFGLTHIRFLILAGIVLPPILASHFGKITSYDPAHERRLLNGVLLGVVVAVLVWGFPSERFLQAQMEDFFPVRAVRYLEAHPQEGNLFNSYEWGGYLEWTLPNVKTFIDSRDDIFEFRGVFKSYLEIYTLKNSQEVLDEYGVSYLLIPAEAPLTYLVSRSPLWVCIYRDNQAVIYRRTRDPGLNNPGGLKACSGQDQPM